MSNRLSLRSSPCGVFSRHHFASLLFQHFQGCRCHTPTPALPPPSPPPPPGPNPKG